MVKVSADPGMYSRPAASGDLQMLPRIDNEGVGSTSLRELAALHWSSDRRLAQKVSGAGHLANTLVLTDKGN